MKSLTITVKGMTCQSCVKSVTKTLSEIGGVSNISVDLVSETASLDYNENQTAPQQLVNAIDDAGFEASLPAINPLKISVKGMTCQSCVKSVTKTLAAFPGVSNIRVDLESDSASLSYDAGLVSPKDLVHAIDDSGFEAAFFNNEKTSIISVKGMTCMSCVNSITQNISIIHGVKRINVDLESESATVQYDSAIISDLQIVAAIDDCGFEASLTLPQSFVAPALPPIRTTPNRINTQSSEDTQFKSAVDRFLGPRSGKSPTLSPLIPLQVLSSTRSTATAIPILNNLGMTCASCVASIERHLKPQPGIFSVKVALLAERAEVEYNPTIYSHPKKIADMINEIGFEASLIESESAGQVDLRIFGMTCASCSNHIERAVGALAGVHSVSVNLLGQTGTFKFDKDVVGVRDIVECIESIGFNALLPDQSDNTQKESLARTQESNMWKRLFYNSLFFSIPVSAISMILPRVVPGVVNYTLLPGLIAGDLAQLILTIPVQFRIGKRFHVAAWKALKHGTSTMDTLVSLGTNIAFVFSCVAILHSICDPKVKATVFFETSTTLVTFIALGRWMENKAKGQTGTALSKLLSLSPSHAIIMSGSTEKQIPLELLQSGDICKILPGSRIPTDGIVTDGSSNVDESLVTGEPIGVKKAVGDALIGGTVNGQGVLFMKATRVGSDTTLAQIVKLVNEAQSAKAPIQAIADRIAGIFVPAVVFFGLTTFAVWLTLLGAMSDKMSDWGFPNGMELGGSSTHFFIALNFAISVIVVACPCALGLATPTAVMGGTSLEAGYRVNKIIFDKTGVLFMLTKGTLTVGKLVVVFQHYSMKSIDGKIPLDDFIFYSIVGAAEAGSEHPLGRSVVVHAKKILGMEENQNFTAKVSNFTAVPGRGMQCLVSEAPNVYAPVSVLIGNAAFLRESNISITSDLGESKAFHESQGCTVIFVAFNGSCAGIIALTDALKPESFSAVQALKKMGLQVAMVTGDQEATARVIAKQCGIDEVYAGVSPAGKKKVSFFLMEIVVEMQRDSKSIERSANMLSNIKGGFVVAMVGDGVNDSASIAQSDLGIACYGGTDVAVEAASIVLMRPDLYDVVTAIDLSRTIFKRIRLNFVWASIYNLLMIPFAMGFFAPFKLTLSPMVSGMAMSLSSVSVVVSSLMIKLYVKPQVGTLERFGSTESLEDQELLSGADRGVSSAVASSPTKAVKLFGGRKADGYVQLEEGVDD